MKKNKYIEIRSDWANPIILTIEEAKNHLETYYWSCLDDWFDNKEKIRIKVIEMTEKKFKELPEWEP